MIRGMDFGSRSRWSRIKGADAGELAKVEDCGTALEETGLPDLDDATANDRRRPVGCRPAAGLDHRKCQWWQDVAAEVGVPVDDVAYI